LPERSAARLQQPEQVTIAISTTIAIGRLRLQLAWGTFGNHHLRVGIRNLLAITSSHSSALIDCFRFRSSETSHERERPSELHVSRKSILIISRSVSQCSLFTCIPSLASPSPAVVLLRGYVIRDARLTASPGFLHNPQLSASNIDQLAQRDSLEAYSFLYLQVKSLSKPHTTNSHVKQRWRQRRW
jgi:hypothetical protein